MSLSEIRKVKPSHRKGEVEAVKRNKGDQGGSGTSREVGSGVVDRDHKAR